MNWPSLLVLNFFVLFGLNAAVCVYSTKKLNNWEFGNDATEKMLIVSAISVDLLCVAAYVFTELYYPVLLTG